MCTWTITLLRIMSRQQTWLAYTISSSNNSRAFTSCSSSPGLFRQFACRWYISLPPCIISTFIWDQPSTVFCHKLAWIQNQYNWSELTSRRGSERRSLRKFMSSMHTFNIQSPHLAASILHEDQCCNDHQCSLCRWPRCKHDYLIAPNVNKTLTIKLNCENLF